MGIRARLGAELGPSLSTIADFGATIKRAASVLFPKSRESISCDMFASNYLPYQASKTFRTIIAESNCRRAQTITEVQRSLRIV